MLASPLNGARLGKPEASGLKQMRSSVNLTVEQVAVQLDIAISTVRNWEQGRTVPKMRLDQFVKLCQLYNCTLEELHEAVRNGFEEIEVA